MLIIKNPNDIKGMNFVDGRFTLREVEIYDEVVEVEKKQETLYNWRDTFIITKH